MRWRTTWVGLFSVMWAGVLGGSSFTRAAGGDGLIMARTTPEVITVGGEHADVPGFTSRAIQLAVDALASRGGGTVRLGPGIYEVSGPIRLVSNLVLEGNGPDTVLRKSDGVRTRFVLDADYGMIRIKVADAAGFPVGSGIQLFDDRNRGGYNVTTALVTAVEGDYLFLDTATIQDYLSEQNGTVSNAFPVIVGSGVENVRIAQLVVDGNRASNDYINGCRGGGVYLFRARNCLLENVVVREFNGDSFSWQVTRGITVRNCEAAHGSGLGFHPGTGSEETLVEDSVSHHNDQDGIFLCYRVQKSVFRRNRVFANGRFGISIGHKDTDNLFEENLVAGNARDGVRFRDEDEENAGHRNVFRRNVVEDNGTGEAAYGFYLGGATRDVVIEANQIRSTGKGGQRAAVFVGTRAGKPRLARNAVSGHPEVVQESGL